MGNTKFTERMVKYEQESRAKKQKIKANEVSNKENLHKPKTGPAPANRNIERLPIGDFLYQKRKKSVIVAKPQPIPSISETSRQIY